MIVPKYKLIKKKLIIRLIFCIPKQKISIVN